MSFDKINKDLGVLVDAKLTDKQTRFEAAVSIANEVLLIFGAEKNSLQYGIDALNNVLPPTSFANEKQKGWFEENPRSPQTRIALDLYDKDSEFVDVKFFMFSSSVSSQKMRIASAVTLTDNYEDRESTHNQNYKVGIDFFLTRKNTVIIAISNFQSIRVMELDRELSNTQKSIFDKLRGVFKFEGIESAIKDDPVHEPQKTIHQMLWENFAVKEVNKKFFEMISQSFELLVQEMEKKFDKNDSQLFASRLLGRLLFLWFLRKKGIISETLNYFEVEKLDSSKYYESKLKVLFFGVLNTQIKDRKCEDKKTPYLNGGLFEPHENDFYDETPNFPKGFFENLYSGLNEFNFTTDESSPDYEQIAIDPEMLGRVFENLLASIVPETAKGASERKSKGAFYTPREIVSYMCNESLKQKLYQIVGVIDNANDTLKNGVDFIVDSKDSEFQQRITTSKANKLFGDKTSEITAKILEELPKIKILDPACGSGAFPIGMLQLLLKVYQRLSAYYDQKTNQIRHASERSGERFNDHDFKLFIMQNNIYGVDIEPMAVEISRLRAWLSIIVEDDPANGIEPLPNLDFKFVCANSLVPLQSAELQLFDTGETERQLQEIRNEYFNARDKNKKEELKNTWQKISEQNTQFESERTKQLKTFNPFHQSKPAEFFDSEVMFGVKSGGK